MKKGLFYLVFAVFFLSFVSAEIIIEQQPKELYNLGDRINFPVAVTTNQGVYDTLKGTLICDGFQNDVFEESIFLSANEAMKLDKSIFLIKKFIGNSKGTCQVKVFFEGDPTVYKISNKFKISDSITIRLDTEEREFNPEDEIVIEGSALRENSEPATGIISINIITEDFSENKTFEGTVNNGFFSLIFTMPKDAKAGQYLVSLKVSEKDPLNEITNNGFADFNILIKQAPTSLEIFFENDEVNPGEDLKVKAILHDQTGQKMPSRAIITIKNSNDKVFEQVEKQTDEFLHFPVLYKESPSEWKVVAVSEKITSESLFTILEKEDVKIEIVNKTVILTNMGNIPYNETLLVKIGNNSINIDSYLKIDETKKYVLTAPDGEYSVDILSDGENVATGKVVLTGNVIDVKEVSGVAMFARYPLAWIFMAAILGFVAFAFFKRGYKKSFFGYISKKKDEGKEVLSEKFSRNKSSFQPKNKAILSLSLKGEKQSASVVCLNVKNFEEIKGENSVKETLGKVEGISSEANAPIYENNNYFFIILSPSTTKTFKNERSAVETAQKVKDVLIQHNKMFKPKIMFGISINLGEIVAKKEDNTLKFMSLGNLIISSKKISSVANNVIYLSKDMRERVISSVKTMREDVKGVEVYSIKEIRKGKEEHKKFITEFIKRLEGSNDKKEN